MSTWPQTCNYCGAPLAGTRCPRCRFQREKPGVVTFSGYTDAASGIERIARGTFVSYDAVGTFDQWTWSGVQCEQGSTLIVALCTVRPGTGFDIRVDCTINGVTQGPLQYDEITETVQCFVFTNVAAGPHDILFTADAMTDYFAGFVTEVKRVGAVVESGSPTTFPASVTSIPLSFNLDPSPATTSFLFTALHTEGPSSDTHGTWANLTQGQVVSHPDGGNSYLTEGWAVVSGTGAYSASNGTFTSRVVSYAYLNFRGVP